MQFLRPAWALTAAAVCFLLLLLLHSQILREGSVWLHSYIHMCLCMFVVKLRSQSASTGQIQYGKKCTERFLSLWFQYPETLTGKCICACSPAVLVVCVALVQQ